MREDLNQLLAMLVFFDLFRQEAISITLIWIL